MFPASLCVSLLLFLLCFIESTQLITMLCSSVAAWEGTDTRSSFCFCTGKAKSHHHRDVCFRANFYFYFFFLFQEMMSSIWSTHISMRTTRRMMWTPLLGSPTFSTSSLTPRVSFDTKPDSWDSCVLICFLQRLFLRVHVQPLCLHQSAQHVSHAYV